MASPSPRKRRRPATPHKAIGRNELRDDESDEKLVWVGACRALLVKERESAPQSDDEDEMVDKTEDELLLSEDFEMCYDYQEYAREIDNHGKSADTNHLMFYLQEDEEENWDGANRLGDPDDQGFLEMDIIDAMRLHKFLLDTSTWFNFNSPLRLPPICFESPGSHLAPFKGLLIAAYRAVWIGLVETSSIQEVASKFETMKLIMVAMSLYSFVQNLDIDTDHPIPERLVVDTRHFHTSSITTSARADTISSQVKKTLNIFKGDWGDNLHGAGVSNLLAPDWAPPTGKNYLKHIFYQLGTRQVEAQRQNTKMSDRICSKRAKKTFQALYSERAEHACYLIRESLLICTDFVHFLRQVGNNGLLGVMEEPYTALYYLSQNVREIMLVETFEQPCFRKLAKVAAQMIFRSNSCGVKPSGASPADKKKFGGKIELIHWNPADRSRSAPNYNKEDPKHRVPYYFEPEYTRWLFNSKYEDKHSIPDGTDGRRSKRNLDNMITIPAGCTVSTSDKDDWVTSINREYADGTYLKTILDSKDNIDFDHPWDITGTASRDADRAARSRKGALTKLRSHWAQHHNGETLPVALRLELRNGFGPPWGKIAEILGVNDEDKRKSWIKRARRAFETEKDRLTQVYSRAHTNEEYATQIATIIKRGLVVFTNAVPR